MTLKCLPLADVYVFPSSAPPAHESPGRAGAGPEPSFNAVHWTRCQRDVNSQGLQNTYHTTVLAKFSHTWLPVALTTIVIPSERDIDTSLCVSTVVDASLEGWKPWVGQVSTIVVNTAWDLETTKGSSLTCIVGTCWRSWGWGRQRTTPNRWEEGGSEREDRRGLKRVRRHFWNGVFDNEWTWARKLHSDLTWKSGRYWRRPWERDEERRNRRSTYADPSIYIYLTCNDALQRSNDSIHALYWAESNSYCQ